MTKKEIIKYIKDLAVNSYEIDAEAIEELIEQLELEEVIELKLN